MRMRHTRNSRRAFIFFHILCCAASYLVKDVVSSGPVYSWVNLKNRSVPLSCMPLAHHSQPTSQPLPWRRQRDHFAVIMMSFTLAALFLIHPSYVTHTGSSRRVPSFLPLTSQPPSPSPVVFFSILNYRHYSQSSLKSFGLSTAILSPLPLCPYRSQLKHPLLNFHLPIQSAPVPME